MKNLKLFVAPLLGAALLTACGPKPIDVKDFRAKVEEKFDKEAITATYVNKKTQHMTGTDFEGNTVDENHLITGVVPMTGMESIYHFTLEGLTTSNYDVLSTGLIDYIAAQQEGATVNYFISGDTYTIEAKGDMGGFKQSAKYVYNKDLVVTYLEMKSSGKIGDQDININVHFNFKYEDPKNN